MKLGYFIPSFPTQTHAFFWRELQAVGELTGSPVAIVSTKQPDADQCLHDFADEARARTTYLLSPGELLRGFVAAVRRPVVAARVLGVALRLGGLALPTRVAVWLSGLRLAAWSRVNGVGHLHVHSAANAALIAMVSRIAGGPTYSVVLHGDPEVYGGHHDMKLGRASCVVPVTRPLAERVRSEGWIDPSRIHVITMGVDTDLFTPGGDRDTDPPLILTVARLNKTKGVQYALEALAELRQEGVPFRFVVLGEGPYRRELARDVERLGLSEVVDLPGTASQDEVLAMLRRATVFALTSFGKGEAAPVSVMEAMATGTPSVVSIIGGSPDMIDHIADGYLVEQKNVQQIRDAFRDLLTSEEIRSRMSACARERAVRAFDYRLLAERVVSVIREPAGGER